MLNVGILGIWSLWKNAVNVGMQKGNFQCLESALQRKICKIHTQYI